MTRTDDEDWEHEPPHALLLAASLAAYVLLAMWGMQLAGPTGFTDWFPAAGLAVAAVALGGPRFVVVPFFGTLISTPLTMADPSLAATVFTGLVLAATYGAGGLLLRRALDHEHPFARVQEAWVLIGVGTVGVPVAAAVLTVGGSIGLGTLPATAASWSTIGSFILGDALGIATIAPTMILAGSVWRREPRLVNLVPSAMLSRPEAIAALTALVVATPTLYVVAGEDLRAIAVLPLCWLALRFGVIVPSRVRSPGPSPAARCSPSSRPASTSSSLASRVPADGHHPGPDRRCRGVRARAHAARAALPRDARPGQRPSERGAASQHPERHAAGEPRPRGYGDARALRRPAAGDGQPPAGRHEPPRRTARRTAERHRRPVGAARPSGFDRFAVLITGATPERRQQIAERIADELSAPLPVGDSREVFVDPRVGITSALPGEAPDAVLAHADHAADTASASDGHRVGYYDAAIERARRERQELTEDLRLATERGEFLLAFQPIVTAKEGRVVAAEALLRWVDRRRGPVSPADFVPWQRRRA